MNSSKPLYKYLSRKKGGVADLVTKAVLLGKLNQEFLKHIPAPVNQHVQLAHIKGNILYVLAETPAWAAKFRFMTAHLTPTLAKNVKHFQYVREISVLTRPLSNLNSKKSESSNPHRLSAEANSCLEQMVASMESSDLQRSLSRLAKRYKPGK